MRKFKNVGRILKGYELVNEFIDFQFWMQTNMPEYFIEVQANQVAELSYNCEITNEDFTNTIHFKLIK